MTRQPATPTTAAELAATHSPGGLLVLDPDGRITYANPAAARLLGHPPADVLGQPLDDVADLREETGSRWWPCTAALRRLPGVRRLPPRTLHLTRGQTTRPVELAATLVRGPDKQLVTVACTLRELRQPTGGRRPALAAERIADIAHELRSPLTSVKGFSATLLRRWDRFSDAQKQHMLATITTDADRLARLVGQLVDLARLESGRLELHPQPVDLVQLCTGVAEATTATHPEHPVETEFPDPPGSVYADRDRITQALGNLLEHTVTHTSGTITVTARPTGAGTELTVHAQGAPAAQPDPTGDLGLDIARGIVHAHGGRLWAHTDPERGTRLRFRLPR